MANSKKQRKSSRPSTPTPKKKAAEEDENQRRRSKKQKKSFSYDEEEVNYYDDPPLEEDEEFENNSDESSNSSDNSSASSNEDDDDDDSDGDGDGGDKVKNKTNDGGKRTAKKVKEAINPTSLTKELRSFNKLFTDKKALVAALTSTAKLIGLLTTQKGYVRVLHSFLTHCADLGEEDDDEHHLKLLGHAGARGAGGKQPTPVIIPESLLTKTKTIDGSKLSAIENFLSNPDNRKKLLLMTDVNKESYMDVPLLPMVPTMFLTWLLEEKRTPFEFYQYVMDCLKELDQDIFKECVDACKPLLNWCLCSCVAEQSKPDTPLTKVPTPISAVVEPTEACAASLSQRLATTMGTPENAQGNSGGRGTQRGSGKSDIASVAATVATAAAAAMAEKVVLGLQQTTAQYSSKVEKAKHEWSTFQWNQYLGFCGVNKREDAPDLAEEIQGVKEPREVRNIIIDAMSEVAHDMSVSLTEFHMDKDRVKEFMKCCFSPSKLAEESALKNGIVILDLVPRSPEECARLKREELEEQLSEQNRSLSESEKLTSRREKNVGEVPSTLHDAKETIINYMVFLRALFGANCPHYLAVFQIKRMLDSADRRFLTAEKIKNLFWCIIVDARQFFFDWNENMNGRPTSNLEPHIQMYKANLYNPHGTLPPSWTDRQYERTRGKGGEKDRDRSGARGNKTKTGGSDEDGPTNSDMHPAIAKEMKPFWNTFTRIHATSILSAAGRSFAELPKLYKGGKQGCLNYMLGQCRQGNNRRPCARAHLSKADISQDDAVAMCQVIGPGVKKMVENKDKYKEICGLRE